MTPEQFLERARAEISDDPKTRLTLLAKTMMEQPDCLIDIHTHIFDKKCLSVGYILLRMAKALGLKALGIEAVETEVDRMELLSKDEPEIYDDIAAKEEDTDEDWALLEKELEKTIDIHETYELFGFNVKDGYKVLRKKNMMEILDFYHEEFSITKLPAFTNHKMVLGILQMDLETGWDFKPKRGFRQQVREIKEISKTRAILPYFAVDPRRAEKNGPDENLYELFLEAFTDKDNPFFGVKCYPALGYLPSDVRLDPIFQICAEKNIPVLTHCGGEAVSTFEKKIMVKNETGYVQFEIPGDTRDLRARYLNEPHNWEPVLKKYNNLKLNLGHFGGGSTWKEYVKDGSSARLDKIFELMRNPNYRVWGDFSYSIIEDDLFDLFKQVLDVNDDILKQSLYGTDFWVVLPAGDLLKKQEIFLDKLKDYHDPLLRSNVLDYLLK
ncbi:MAG: amidohydrolase family protein [Saprospiraceae bacterium]|nr:amidohydrolase family protein [Saprospiraceae bacterium]